MFILDNTQIKCQGNSGQLPLEVFAGHKHDHIPVPHRRPFSNELIIAPKHGLFLTHPLGALYDFCC